MAPSSQWLATDCLKQDRQRHNNQSPHTMVCQLLAAFALDICIKSKLRLTPPMHHSSGKRLRCAFIV